MSIQPTILNLLLDQERALLVPPCRSDWEGKLLRDFRPARPSLDSSRAAIATDSARLPRGCERSRRVARSLLTARPRHGVDINENVERLARGHSERLSGCHELMFLIQPAGHFGGRAAQVQQVARHANLRRGSVEGFGRRLPGGSLMLLAAPGTAPNHVADDQVLARRRRRCLRGTLLRRKNQSRGVACRNAGTHSHKGGEHPKRLFVHRRSAPACPNQCGAVARATCVPLRSRVTVWLPRHKCHPHHKFPGHKASKA